TSGPTLPTPILWDVRQVLTLREVLPVAGRQIRLDGLPTRSGLKHQFRTVATGLGLLLGLLGATMLAGWWIGAAPAVRPTLPWPCCSSAGPSWPGAGAPSAPAASGWRPAHWQP
ncbi:MAG TPA: hypothetical protein VLD58_13460, partial [Gemmatimonadales bacterium]|nr:hypothetical protein [Gemmatimonadales bacterium]